MLKFKINLDPSNKGQMGALALFASALAGEPVQRNLTPDKRLDASVNLEAARQEEAPAKPEKKRTAATPKKEIEGPTPKEEDQKGEKPKSNITLDDIRKRIAERKQETDWAEIRVQSMQRFNVKNINQLEDGDLEDFFNFISAKDQAGRDQIR